jgi:hypothetical protein
MSSDTQFTALGPTSHGFQTSGTNILIGVYADGNHMGVHGRGPIGVLGDGGGIGVQGNGAAVGVFGEGALGVQGKGTSEGVHGEGLIGVLGRGETGVSGNGTNGPGVVGRGSLGSPGVHGQSITGPGVLADGGTGVFASGTDGAGVHATSKEVQAAILQSTKMAQLWLIPLRIKDPKSLPRSTAGELLATVWRDVVPADVPSSEITSLWFCKIGGDPTQANWVKLA